MGAAAVARVSGESDGETIGAMSFLKKKTVFRPDRMRVPALELRGDAGGRSYSSFNSIRFNDGHRILDFERSKERNGFKTMFIFFFHSVDTFL